MGKVQGYNEYVAMAAASAPNNSVFIDSADNLLKTKDNTGTVTELAGGGSEFRIYEFLFNVDAADTTNWQRTNPTSSTGINEYNISMGVSKTSSAATIDGSGYIACVPLCAIKGNQTISHFSLSVSGLNHITNVAIVKVRYAASTATSITVLYEDTGTMTFTQKGTDDYYYDVADTSFSVTSLSDGDFVYVIYGSSSTGNTRACYHQLKTTVD